MKDGEYALGIVSGIFKNKEEKEILKNGQPNTIWQDYKKYLDIDELLKLNEQNNISKQISAVPKNSNIADFLETHLDSTQVLPDGSVYKIKRFIASTGDLRIEVYPKDHSPRHFHVISKQRKINARFDIQTLNLLNTKHGSIQEKDIKKIQIFFKTNPNYLKKLKSEYTRMQ